MIWLPTWEPLACALRGNVPGDGSDSCGGLQSSGLRSNGL